MIGAAKLLSTRGGSTTSTQAVQCSVRTAAITSGCGGAWTILALPRGLNRVGEAILPDGIVPFPRGFGFGPDGDLYLASGVGPSGEGDNTIAVFDHRGALRTPRLVDDPELSPLDLVLAPNGHIVVSSAWPFGARNATSSIREFDHATGALTRVFARDPAIGFARPRGLRFGSDGHLYCVGQDHVIAFDFFTGTYLGVAVRLPKLNGQALVLWDRETLSRRNPAARSNRVEPAITTRFPGGELDADGRRQANMFPSDPTTSTWRWIPPTSCR